MRGEGAFVIVVVGGAGFGERRLKSGVNGFKIFLG